MMQYTWIAMPIVLPVMLLLLLGCQPDSPGDTWS